MKGLDNKADISFLLTLFLQEYLYWFPFELDNTYVILMGKITRGDLSALSDW